MSWLDIGDRERLQAEFRNEITDALANPTTVTLTVRTPAGVSTTYTPVNASTGVYHYDVDLTEQGTWHYRWAATGSLVVAEEGILLVRRRRVGA